MFGYLPWSVNWPVVTTFPGMSFSPFFLPVFFQNFVVYARLRRKSATHTSAVTRARGARPPDRPDSSNPMPSVSTPTSEQAMQSSAPASSLVEPPPAESPQLGRWICKKGLTSARMKDLLLLPSTTVLAFSRGLIFGTGRLV